MNPFRINAFALGFVLAFPALVNVYGDPRSGQGLLHLTALPLFLIVAATYCNTKSAVRAPFAAVFGYVAVTMAYYLFVVIVNANEIDGGAFTDIGRPVIYGFYFLFPFVVPLETRQLERVVNWMVAACLLQLVFSALVYLPGAAVLQDVYKGRLSTDAVVFHYYRWSGTLAWPSDFAFFLSLFIYYAYLRFLKAPSLRSRLRSGVLAVVLGVGVVMTTSRGGLGSVAIMLALITLLWGRLRHIAVFAGAGALSLLLLFFLAEMDLGEHLQVGYVTSLLEGDELDASTGHRTREFDYAVDIASSHFPIGVGPAREEIAASLGIVESLYGHHLIKWGAGGLALYFVGFAFIARRLRLSARRTDSMVVRDFANATLMWAVSVPLAFGWSSAVTDRFKCLPLFYLIVGQVLASRRCAQELGEVEDSDAAPVSRVPVGRGPKQGAHGMARMVNRWGDAA